MPDWVSIQNEPDFIPPDWEGCKFEPSETAQYPGYDKALAAVHAALQKLNPPPKMLGPEVLGIHYNKVQNYLRPMNQDLVVGVSHHLYEQGSDGVWDWRDPGPDSYVDEMLGVAEATRKPLFQTEFQTDEDKGIDGGFETAWLIHHTMAAEGAVAFVYWDLIWEGTAGLVGMRGKTPKPRDQYYSMRHFARFTDPGYIRVGANSDAKAGRGFGLPFTRRKTHHRRIAQHGKEYDERQSRRSDAKPKQNHCLSHRLPPRTFEAMGRTPSANSGQRHRNASEIGRDSGT